MLNNITPMDNYSTPPSLRGGVTLPSPSQQLSIRNEIKQPDITPHFSDINSLARNDTSLQPMFTHRQILQNNRDNHNGYDYNYQLNNPNGYNLLSYPNNQIEILIKNAETLNPQELSYLQNNLDKIKKNKLQSTRQNNKLNNVTPSNIPQQHQTQKFVREPIAYCINLADKDIQRNQNPVQGLLPSAGMYNLQENINIRELSTPIFNAPVPTNLGKKKTNNLDYYNPYEYSGKQQEFGMLERDIHLGPYGINEDLLDYMGIDAQEYIERFPNGIRNVNVESAMKYGEISRNPKQSGLSMVELNRFNFLPWDPQDYRHIIRPDGYPQAGINTRLDKLEYQ